MNYFNDRLTRRAMLFLAAGTTVAAAAPVEFYTPEKFGADPTGRESSSIAFAKMLNAALVDGVPCISDREGSTYRFDRPVMIQTRGKPLSFQGLGAGKTKIILDGWFTGLSVNGTAGFENRVELRDFEITRSDYQSYDGPIGKRSIEVTRSKGVAITGIKESGSIGFGIFLDRCQEYEISGCTVTDHFTGKTHRSGTDGIHIYRSPGPGKVFGNVVRDVGDDAISFGSFAAGEPTLDFECHNNKVQDTAGSIKAYGNIRRFSLHDNEIVRPKTGGVVLYDDRGPAQSFVMSDGEIFGNVVRGQIGAGICGGIAIWSPTGDGNGIQRNIVIRNNHIENGNFGITVASQAPHKAPMDIVIQDNSIVQMRQRGIMIDRFAGSFVVTGNQIEDTGFEGAYLGRVQDGKTAISLRFATNKLSNLCVADPRRPPIKAVNSDWVVAGNFIDGVRF